MKEILEPVQRNELSFSQKERRRDPMTLALVEVEKSIKNAADKKSK
jgi:hypothetical protein